LSMEDALMEELGKKLELTEKLAALVAAQNASIKNNDMIKAASFETEKSVSVEDLSAIDNSLKPFMFKNKRYPRSIEDMVKKINLSLAKLVDIERENGKLLSEMELSRSGRHIEAYKRAIKP
jgi:hypothetical protein